MAVTASRRAPAIAEVGRRDVQVVPDLGRRPRRACVLVEHLDAVADVHDQRHVVVDEQHAGAVLVAHRPHDRRELRHLRLREPRRRLVHQHEARLGGERTSHAEPALVSVASALRAPRRRSTAQQANSSSARRRARGRARPERGDLDVLAHREPAKGMAVLEGTSQAVPRPAIGPPPRDLVRRAHGPGVGGIEPAQHVDERRLSRPIGADQPDDLVTLELEGHLLQARTPAKDRETAAARSDAPGRLSFPDSALGSAMRLPDVRDDLRGDQPTNLGWLLWIRMTRYARPVTACRFLENVTRPRSVGTFLNFSICAASATPSWTSPA